MTYEQQIIHSICDIGWNLFCKWSNNIKKLRGCSYGQIRKNLINAGSCFGY